MSIFISFPPQAEFNARAEFNCEILASNCSSYEIYLC